ncbi:MAG: RluA family pseudouridine synthase [Bacteroidales bacterium]|nr:RluA family pseudouridine synthase [Bacteroidales bacterium]
MQLDDRILYEDNHLIIVNKLAGEIVQGDKTGDIPLVESVKEYLKTKYNKPGNVFCGLVHRIDRPVSGAVIFAKTSKALARMNELVKNREITKIYLAVVETAPQISEQRLTDWLFRNEKANKTVVSHTEKAGYVKAELAYKVVRQLTNYTLLEVELYTGRHHQIRAQLSANGTIIKGDLKYGARRSNRDGSISLHSYKVAFEHPVSHRLVTVIAPLSGEMAKMLGGDFPIL